LSIVLNGSPPQSHEASAVMRDHTVLTATRDR